MDDLISRREAIDAIEGITASMSVCINADEHHGMTRMRERAVLEVANLPSAQPEIIRCRDCKHYNAGFECLIEGYGVETEPNHFCGYAERREDGVDSRG